MAGVNVRGMTRHHAIAVCADETLPGFGCAVALNAESDGAWVQLTPRGPRLSGLDGRAWTLADPEALIAAFNRRGLALPIDVEHAQFVKAPKGEPAPAAGWIEEIQNRDGEIFGRVAWTPKGRRAVNSRDYRYLSPAFAHDAKGNVTELLGAGLVNRPNFQMAALNHEAPMFKDLLKKLGLPETATEADAIAKVSDLQTALNSSQVGLANFVPRADYEIAVNRAATLEAEVTASKKGARDAEVASLIEGALKAGKISPATKDFYVATCASEDGLAHFRKFVEAAPSVFSGADLGRRPVPGANDVALNAEQEAGLVAMGLTKEQYIAALK